MGKIQFKSINGLGIVDCDNPAIVRPFKVMFELQAEDGPNISNTRYYARICSTDVSTKQLYKELDKAMEISKETYDSLMKIKRTWCERQVLSGRMSAFAVTPGMVNHGGESATTDNKQV